MDDDKFSYYEKSTIINDGVWLRVGAIVLAGSEIEGLKHDMAFR